MKIHQLELEFVGPFAGKQVINFDDFLDSKVFLIEGPTGSGKSTLIDALVFGLYGSPATDRASTDRMRSDFAESNDESRVRVVFETKSGIYAITRTPKYERLAKKGAERLTTKQPTVLFERLDDPQAPAGEVLSSKVREADLEVVRVIGLDRNQFRQTIILPQGEFARFLTAKSQERKAILQSIFKTQVFAGTAEVLRLRANKAENDERELLGELANRLASFAGVADVDDLELQAGDPQLDTTIDEYLEATAAKLLKRESKAAKKLSKTEAKLKAAAEHNEALISAQSNFDTFQKLKAQQAQLAELDPEVQRQEETVKQIAAALTLKPQLTELTEAQEASVRSESDIDSAQLALRKITERLLGSDTGLLEDANQTLDQHNAETDSLTQEIERGVQLVAQHESLAQQSEIAKATVVQLKEQHLAAVEAERLQAQLDATEPERQRLLKASQAAAAEEHQLQLQRIQGIAGELAKDLETGQPCVVCGAVDHPSPAALSDEHPSEADVDMAFAKSKELQGQLEQIQDQHLTLTTKLASASSTAKGQSVQEVTVLLTEADTTLTKAQSATKAKETLTQELENARRVLETRAAAKARFERAEGLLAKALDSSSIANSDQLQALLGLEDSVTDLQEQVDVHKATVKQVQDQLASPELTGAQAVPEPELLSAQERTQKLQSKFAKRQDKLALANSALGRTQGQAIQVRRQLDTYNEQSAASRPLVRLSKIVNATDGLNQRGIPLETYVLLHQFEHVVDAANVRLRQISQGRFTLQTSAEKQGRDRKGGLNLEILDHNSNAVRSPGDISGGETFYVSLSLALGLADVVTSQSGGIELGTLLIDEGFGTLDPEVLDQVLRVIEKLSDNNRAVGIVSHVEELKERISDQIQVVRREDHTSTLRIVS